MIQALVWLAVVQALAIGVYPLASRVFASLPGAGYGFSKVLGITLVGYLAWFGSTVGLTNFSRAAVGTVALVLAAGCWLAWGPAGVRDLRARWPVAAFLEVVFLGTFGVAVFVRAYNPDIVGQEKFMDYALMNAFLKASDLPTEDPWLAGFGVPYYHLNYLILGVPTKISGIPGPVGYNLAVAFVFAAGFLGSTTVVYGLLALGRAHNGGRVCRSSASFGLLGGTLVMVVGNLEAVLEIVAAMGWGDRQFWQTVGVKGLAAAGEGTSPLEGTWWWRASRVIPNIPPDGITEFPYFSFLLGDLHPHYTAIPLNLVIVGVALVVLSRGTSALRGPRALGIAGSVLAGVLLGVLVAANTWDVPTLWGLLFAASALAVWRRYGSWAEARGELGRAAVPFVLAPLTIAPYFVGYSSQPLGLALVTERTPAISLLILFGPFLLAVTAFALWLGFSRGYGVARTDLVSWPATIGIGIAAILIWLGELTFVLLGTGLALLAWAGVRSPILLRSDGKGTCSARTYCWLLALLGVTILAGVEILYIRDVFGTRMNTVFKFHYDAWMLLGLSSAGGLGLLWQRSGASGQRAGSAWRIVAFAVAALIVLLGLAYPLAATWTKSGGFRGAATLDGSRFLQRSRPADHQAIVWLQANTSDRPVVIEAVGPDYQEFARVSTFSGLPTIMGWIGHELQWRGDRIDYGRRQQDVDAIYRATTLEELLARAQPYRARYLFFGSLERDRYGPEAQQQLSRLLRPVYGQGGTSIFLLPGAEGEERSP